jgi:hypothetical protein
MSCHENAKKQRFHGWRNPVLIIGNPPKKRQRVHRTLSGSDNDEPPPKCVKGGRPAGSSSYGSSELQHLFATVEEQLAMGQKGWKEVERRYNK